LRCLGAGDAVRDPASRGGNFNVMSLSAPAMDDPPRSAVYDM
jgi:hypothetical protein